jgi:hypothetical protein
MLLYTYIYIHTYIYKYKPSKHVEFDGNFKSLSNLLLFMSLVSLYLGLQACISFHVVSS